MDRVTLKHYEERAAKGRAIINKIEQISSAIDRAKQSTLIRIFSQGGREVDVNEHRNGERSPDNARTHLAALMINVFIDNSLHQIRELEAKLAEL